MEYKIIKNDYFDLIEIKNDNSLVLSVSDLGAGIYKIEYNGNIMNYGPKEPAVYADPKFYHGKTIGRFAGRIKAAKWRDYQFVANENSNLLHSGKYGAHDKVFKYRIQECDNYTKVVFRTSDSGKKSLFPGVFNLEVTYKVYRNVDKFEIIFKTRVTEDCVVNLTNHAYYCLGSESLDDLKMKINCSNYVAVDHELIPTEIKPVDRVFDFRKMKRVTRDIYDKDLQAATSTGYDHLFILDTKNAAKPQLILKNDEISMKIYTDFEAIQFYANCYPADFVNLHDKKDALYLAAALEPQLNTFDIEHTVQKKDEVRKNRIVYKFDSIK